MPLIVRWPGQAQAGAQCEALVQNLDFAPTSLAAAGVKEPEDMQGKSLLPLLRGGEPEDWREAVYYHYYEFPGVHAVPRHYGVRTDRYKLIHYYQLDEWELFDLREDPREMRSVYGEPRYDKVVAELKDELRRLQREYGDTRPEAPLGQVLQPVLRRQAATTPTELVSRLETDLAPAPDRLDVMGKPVLVGARCVSAQESGVLVATGGESYGLSLYLKDARPRFTVRSDDGLYEVLAPHPVIAGRSTHLAGELTAEGELRLYVEGVCVATASGAIISGTPADGLSIACDTGSRVGQYDDEYPYEGTLRDIRVYFGTVAEDVLSAWVTASREGK